MELIKFDLQRALAGDKVVTRDGREVTEIVHFKTAIGDYPLIGILNSGPSTWATNGQVSLYDAKDNPADLFMAPTPVEVFGIVTNAEVCYCSKSSVAEAIEYRDKYKMGLAAKSICKLTILNGEVVACETVFKY